MPNVHSSSLDSVEAGAPANEIEITPEMIEAGIAVINGRKHKLRRISVGKLEPIETAHVNEARLRSVGDVID